MKRKNSKLKRVYKKYSGGAKDARMMLDNKILKDLQGVEYIYEILQLDKIDILRKKCNQISTGTNNETKRQLIRKIKLIMQPENVGQLMIQNQRLLTSYKFFVLMYKMKIYQMKNKYEQIKHSKIVQKVGSCIRRTRKTISRGVKSIINRMSKTKKKDDRNQLLMFQDSQSGGTKKDIKLGEYFEVGATTGIELLESIINSGENPNRILTDIGDDQINCGNNKLLEKICNVSNFFENNHPLINTILDNFIKILQMTLNLPLITTTLIITIKGVSFLNFLFRLYFANNKILTNFDTSNEIIVIEFIKLMNKVGILDFDNENVCKKVKDNNSLFISKIENIIHYKDTKEYRDKLDDINLITDKIKRDHEKKTVSQYYSERAKIEMETLKLFIQKVIMSRIDITYMIDNIFNNIFYNGILNELLANDSSVEDSSEETSKETSEETINKLEISCNNYVKTDLLSKGYIDEIDKKLKDLKKLIMYKSQNDYLSQIVLYYLILLYNSPEKKLLDEEQNIYNEDINVTNTCLDLESETNTTSNYQLNSGINSSSEEDINFLTTETIEKYRPQFEIYSKSLTSTNDIIKIVQENKDLNLKLITMLNYINLYIKYKLILFVTISLDEDTKLTINYDDIYGEIRKQIEDEYMLKKNSFVDISKTLKDKLARIFESYKYSGVVNIDTVKFKANLDKEIKNDRSPLGTLLRTLQHNELNENIGFISKYINEIGF